MFGWLHLFSLLCAKVGCVYGGTNTNMAPPKRCDGTEKAKVKAKVKGDRVMVNVKVKAKVPASITTSTSSGWGF